MPDPQAVAPQPTDPTITDVPRTGKERVLGAVGGLLGAAGMSGGEPADPRTGGLSAMMDQQHQQRLNQAKRHQQDMITATSILHTGIDPQTNAPLTADRKAYFQQQYTDAGAAYAKIAGVSPEAKKAVQQHQAVMDHVIAAGQRNQGITPPPGMAGTTAAVGATGGASAGAAPAGPSAGAAAGGAGVAQGAMAGLAGGGGPPGGGMTPPPGAVGGANGGGVSPAQSNTPTPPPPIPPSKQGLISTLKSKLKKFQDDGIDYGPGTPEEMVAPLIRQEMQDNRQVALVGREYGAQEAEAVKGKLELERKEMEQRIRMAPQLGLKPGTPQYLQWVSGGKIGGTGFGATPLQRAVIGSSLLASNPNISTEGGDPIDPSKTYDVLLDKSTGSQYAMESGQTAGMRTPTAKYMPGGPPAGIMEGGKFKTPGDPDWTAANQKQFDAMTNSYLISEREKDKRQVMYANSRAEAYAKSHLNNLTNLQTGEIEAVTTWEAMQHPGLYGYTSSAAQLAGMEGAFKEIDYSMGIINDAEAKGVDKLFTPKARLQLALVLRDSDPKSALSSFVNSEAAAGMSQEMIDYASAVVSMQESALMIRNVGKMGSATDRVRAAITGMVPGVTTGSKEQFDRQMKLLRGELDTLHQNMLKAGNLTPGARVGNPPNNATPTPPQAPFKVKSDWPPAPKADNKVLKDSSGTIVAKSKEGKWVNPGTP